MDSAADRRFLGRERHYLKDWLTQMCPDNLVATHGVVECTSSSTSLARALEELERDGFTILPNLLDAAELEHARQSLDRINTLQIEELDSPEDMAKINDVGISRALLVSDDFFLHRVAVNPRVMEIVHAVLGQNVSLSSQVGIHNHSKGELYQYAWHRELQYQHFVSSRPLAIQSLFCIDDFTAETGGTLFLPGTHMFEAFPSEGYVLDHQIQITAPAGSAVVFNAMLYHRAGVNSSSQQRRAINNLYTLPFIQQQISFAKMLDGRHGDDPELAGLLGYRWGTADSVLDWRRAHIVRDNS